jgi:hypothetical protein
MQSRRAPLPLCWCSQSAAASEPHGHQHHSHSVGPAGAPYDLRWLDATQQHHTGALRMSARVFNGASPGVGGPGSNCGACFTTSGSTSPSITASIPCFGPEASPGLV